MCQKLTYIYHPTLVLGRSWVYSSAKYICYDTVANGFRFDRFTFTGDIIIDQGNATDEEQVSTLIIPTSVLQSFVTGDINATCYIEEADQYTSTSATVLLVIPGL